jgi:hypothetical protein
MVFLEMFALGWEKNSTIKKAGNLWVTRHIFVRSR